MPLKVMFWGTYDPSVPRNAILIRGLRANGIEVLELNRVVWKGLGSGSTNKIIKVVQLAVGYLIAFPVLIAKFLFSKKPDVVIIGYLGIFDTYVFWLLSKISGVPFFWDVYISLYNTVVEDRRLVSKTSLIARALYHFESTALRLPDKVFIDTEVHKQYLCESFGLDTSRAFFVHVGADDSIFQPGIQTRSTENVIKVLFYGSLIPLHGIETILGAIERSAPGTIHWTIVGSGQEQAKLETFLESYRGTDVDWVPWLNHDELLMEIWATHVCLGIFGATEKAARVIPNKVYQAILCGKPVVTRCSPALFELEDRTNIWSSVAGDSAGLLAGIHDAAIAEVELSSFYSDQVRPDYVVKPLVYQLKELE